jgi:hypothetical protein
MKFNAGNIEVKDDLKVSFQDVQVGTDEVSKSFSGQIDGAEYLTKLSDLSRDGITVLEIPWKSLANFKDWQILSFSIFWAVNVIMFILEITATTVAPVEAFLYFAGVILFPLGVVFGLMNALIYSVYLIAIILGGVFLFKFVEKNKDVITEHYF